MTDPTAAYDLDRARLLAAGQIEEARVEIDALVEALDRAPRWRPGRGLRAQCTEALTLLDNMGERLRRKLVVALVGPTGAGKSTLLNALAGVDGLSPVGVDRPTTRRVVVFSRDRDDAAPLLERLGHDRVEVTSSPAALALEHLILVDTPDINSQLLDQHRPLVEAVIREADALVCVFNVENPKARDDADFLAPFVAAFPSRLVLAVLNHCDRQDPDELLDEIRPDFENHLAAAWDRPPEAVYCISARRHLRRPDWPDGAAPRHDVDEYEALTETLFGSMNRASAVLDARIERARHLVGGVAEAVARQVDGVAEALKATRKQVAALDGQALQAAAADLGASDSRLTSGADALFYQRLAAAWWGPVGWLVGLWARLLMIGTGLVNMLRFGNPLRQLWGTVTALARFKQSRESIDDAQTGEGLGTAAVRYRLAVEQAWPELAESLVDAGFHPSVRDSAVVAPDPDELGRRLAASWNRTFSRQLDRAAHRLSGLWLQLLLNAVVLVPAVGVAVQSVSAFLAGRLLSEDYFRHALITLILLWLLSFVLFQIAARLSGGERLIRQTLANLLDDLRTNPESPSAVPLLDEIDAVRRLGR